MTRPADFTRTVKLAAWARAGGPDDPRCECGCGLPITPGDPAEYHHVEEAESGDSPERIAYLRSLGNCQALRRSCHKRITATETAPKIAKSRSVRAGQANAKPKARRPLPGGKDGPWKAKLDGSWERRE